MGATPGQARTWQASFGAALRQARLDASLSQMALAERVGLHPTYLSGIERGERNVSLVNIHVLAAGLGLSPKAFFDK